MLLEAVELQEQCFRLAILGRPGSPRFCRTASRGDITMTFLPRSRYGRRCSRSRRSSREIGHADPCPEGRRRQGLRPGKLEAGILGAGWRSQVARRRAPVPCRSGGVGFARGKVEAEEHAIISADDFVLVEALRHARADVLAVAEDGEISQNRCTSGIRCEMKITVAPCALSPQ